MDTQETAELKERVAILEARVAWLSEQVARQHADSGGKERPFLVNVIISFVVTFVCILLVFMFMFWFGTP
ncbi:hypothetical protein [Paenibacillus sp. GCM10027626]|uniref:hypothetical protein n=1 Tax=Paenibacillus sp. GCM10027626 TaxID=3273411 RepID=UPI003643A0D9